MAAFQPDSRTDAGGRQADDWQGSLDVKLAVLALGHQQQHQQRQPA